MISTLLSSIHFKLRLKSIIKIRGHLSWSISTGTRLYRKRCQPSYGIIYTKRYGFSDWSSDVGNLFNGDSGDSGPQQISRAQSRDRKRAEQIVHMVLHEWMRPQDGDLKSIMYHDNKQTESEMEMWSANSHQLIIGNHYFVVIQLYLIMSH